MKLGKEFYMQSALTVAPALLGKRICHRTESGHILSGVITETEIYFGENDTACHASRGKTPRTQVMYEAGGIAYVYLCYGMHHMLNVVTGKKEHPEAVLIRGIADFPGPGKLTKALSITRTLNGVSFTDSDILWIEDEGNTPDFLTAPRVGIDYAAPEDRNRPWRFVATNL